jgi:hypothetical protein
LRGANVGQPVNLWLGIGFWDGLRDGQKYWDEMALFHRQWIFLSTRSVLFVHNFKILSPSKQGKLRLIMELMYE